ncbi:hypothetical protein GWI33_020352 [Rhynchophorus ferrugineus]|uniref:HTH psq-type domain-containing protein n=1 Tax=Rhynchophorus ferrugineus TaxID=354439 RepID=A0A834M5Y9_RHYFE|nr:hypothetical protein GWI33_020352 [Rhynchophorus ferrugineus]
MCRIKKRSQKRYWFKLMNVRRVQEGESKASVSRSLGIPEFTLRGWIKKREILCQGREEQNNGVEIDHSLASTAEELEGSGFIEKKRLFRYTYICMLPDLYMDPFIQEFCQSIQQLTTQFGPIQQIRYTGCNPSIETQNFIKRWDEEQRKLTINQKQSGTNTTYSQDQSRLTTLSAGQQTEQIFNWGSKEALLFIFDMVRRSGYEFGIFCYGRTRTPLTETNPFLRGFNEYKELLQSRQGPVEANQ